MRFVSTLQVLVLFAYHCHSVHHLAYMMNVEVDLSPLRKGLAHLHHSSHSLDREKVDAEEELIKLMAEWAKLKRREGWLSKELRKLIDWLRDRFGRHPCKDTEGDIDDFDELEFNVKELPRFGANGLMQPRIGRAPAWAREQQDKDKHDDVVEDFKHKHKNKKHKHKKRHWGERRKLLKRLYRAAARVRCANAKLIGFERGLTIEDGLKGREWYKHLGVAPGKWHGECCCCDVGVEPFRVCGFACSGFLFCGVVSGQGIRSAWVLTTLIICCSRLLINCFPWPDGGDYIG